MITFTDADKDDIVHLHNGLRNKIALGKQHPFPSAVKMQTLVCFNLSFLFSISEKLKIKLFEKKL